MRDGGYGGGESNGGYEMIEFNGTPGPWMLTDGGGVAGAAIAKAVGND